jgi:peptidoglycan/LPS O-acetylase OafA/YrhL
LTFERSDEAVEATLGRLSSPPEPTLPVAGASSRSAGLDALRAIACAMVVLFHLNVDVGVSFGPLDPFVGGGNIGIYIFFALSGYLLYRPFVRRPVELGGYAVKRAARILPGYYLAVICLMALTHNSLPLKDPLPYLTLASSYDVQLRGFLGVAWTLSAELVFYLSLPFIARLINRHEVLGLTWLALGSMMCALSLSIFLSPTNEWLVGSFPTIFYAFVPGMVLAVVERTRPGLFARMTQWPFLVGGIVLVAFGALDHAAIIGWAAVIGAALLMGWLLHHRVPFAGTFAFLGGMSYAMYLWHRDLFLAFGVIGLPLALIGAAISWFLLERPVLHWAHRVTRPQSVSTGGEQPVVTGAEQPASATAA